MTYKEKIQKAEKQNIFVLYDLLSKDNIVGIYKFFKIKGTYEEKFWEENFKKEWILNGETVICADFNSIKDTLGYAFATEKNFSYEGLSVEASVKQLAKFASDIWQIHPFGEGNTRAAAVFMINI